MDAPVPDVWELLPPPEDDPPLDPPDELPPELPPLDPPDELPPELPPLDPPDELPPLEEDFELDELDDVAIFIKADLTAMSMVLVISGVDMLLVTSISISFLNVGLDRTSVTDFSRTDCPAGVIRACCNWVVEMVSAMSFCMRGVSISSRTAFWISIGGALDELLPPDDPPLDPPDEPLLDPPEDPPLELPLSELPPLDPPDDELVPCSGDGEPRLMLHPERTMVPAITNATPNLNACFIGPHPRCFLNQRVSQKRNF